MAPAGPVSLLSDVFILFLLKESRSLHNVPNAENVSTVCALISLAPIRIAVKNGNFIGLRLRFSALNVSQRMQLSAGQCALASTFFLSLVKSNAMSLSIFFFKTLPMFQTSTGSLLIESTVSPDINHIFCPRRSDDTLSIFAGVEIKSPLINPCFHRKFTVGMR